jgi:peptidoglycan/LPS O-acetylase OafA/YrhL
MGNDATGHPRSRRDRGLTALIEGFFGFVWFGWGQANASAGLRVGLAVAGVAAALVALAGGVQAFRSPVSTGVGAGALLTGFALAALAGGRAEEAPQLISPDPRV